MTLKSKVIYPNELLAEMNVEGTIFPESSSPIGVANLSHQEGSSHVLRIYQLLFNNDQNAYEFVQELTAFTFNSRQELIDFLESLPHLNGLEMLMLLNPLQQTQEYLN